jgi:hypothetical protein
LQAELQETLVSSLQKLKEIQSGCNKSDKSALCFQASFTIPQLCAGSGTSGRVSLVGGHPPEWVQWVQNAAQTSLKSPHIFHFQTTPSS